MSGSVNVAKEDEEREHPQRGIPVVLNPGGVLLDPGVGGVLDADEDHDRWRPANEAAELLVLGGEACCDVMSLERLFLNKESRKRATKNLSVPVCNILDVATSIAHELNGTTDEHRQTSKELRSRWPDADLVVYVDACRRVKKARENLRLTRNKLGAHLDQKALRERLRVVAPETVVRAFGDALLVLLVATNYPPSWFSWVRAVGEDPRDFEINATGVISTRWRVDDDWPIPIPTLLTLSADPRSDVRDLLLEGLSAYNRMARVLPSGNLPLMEFSERSTAEG